MQDEDTPYWLKERPSSEVAALDAVDALAGMTSSDDPSFEAMLVGALCDRRPDMMASIADLVSGEDRDLSLSWLWAAAAFGHRPSQFVVARELLCEAGRRLETPVAKTLSEGWKSLNGRLAWSRSDAEPVGRKAMSMESGSKHGLRHRGHAASPKTPAGRRISVADLAERSRAVAAKAGSPTKRVLDAIGDKDSKEGRAIAARYGVLLRDIPLVVPKVRPAELEAELARLYPWARDAARAVAGMLALSGSMGVRHAAFDNLLLVGPPGSGKSAFCADVCRLVGLPSFLVSVGGSSEGKLVEGTGRQWANALPGLPVLAMTAPKGGPVGNPAIILDEVEKGSRSHLGSVTDALLPLLEKRSTPKYWDTALMGNVDVSSIVWMATANTVGPLPEAFRSRFRAIRFPAPGAEHFGVCLSNIVASEARRAGVDPRMLPRPDPEAMEWMKDVMARHRGNLRQLRQAWDLWAAEAAVEEASRPN